MAELANPPMKNAGDVTRPERTRRTPLYQPRVDIRETDHELTLFAEIPGVKPENVSLRYENGELVIQGKVEPYPGNATKLLQEYDRGDFYRSFTIHESIDAGRIEAECKNGILTVHLPKVETVKPRQIEIKAV